MSSCDVNAVSLCDAVAPFHQDILLGIVNLSHDGDRGGVDKALKKTQCKISGHLRVVDGAHALAAEVGALSACGGERKIVVDVVAHSTSKDQVLVFDGWELRGNGELRKIFGAMQNAFSRIHAIRLIGCKTGVTDAGKSALAEIQEVVGSEISVYGTIADVNANDFSESQYRSIFLQSAEGALPPVGAPMVPELGAGRVQGAVLERLAGKTKKAAAQQMLAWKELRKGLRSGEPFVSPGLLLEPLWSGEIPFESSNGQAQGMQVDVLYDWRFLRVWPLGGEEGLIFEIDSLVRLQRSLTSLRAKHVGPARRISL